MNDERFEQLLPNLLRRPAAPTAFETEAFVARVMARLPAATDPLAWLTPRWLVPAFGVAAAALALSFRSLPAATGGDAAASLLLGADRGAGTLVASADSSPADLLGLGDR